MNVSHYWFINYKCASNSYAFQLWWEQPIYLDLTRWTDIYNVFFVRACSCERYTELCSMCRFFKVVHSIICSFIDKCAECSEWNANWQTATLQWQAVYCMSLVISASVIELRVHQKAQTSVLLSNKLSVTCNLHLNKETYCLTGMGTTCISNVRH